MHNNNVTLAIMVDGKSLYEDKTNVFIPFGTEYELFVKNNNNYDILVKVNVSLLNDDVFIVKAKSKRTIKGFSEDGVFYAFRFIERIKEIAQNQTNQFVNANLNISIFKKDIPVESIISSQKSQQILPLGTQPFQSPFSSPFDIQLNDDVDPMELLKNLEIDPNNVSYSMDSGSKPELRKLTGQIKSTANTNSISLNSISSLSGIQTYGKPVEEKDDLETVGNRMMICSFAFVFQGNDFEGNKITKPLLAKNLVNCKVCNHKSKPSDTYCSKCGSYIIKTAALIDQEFENKTCCGKILPRGYGFCPFCSKKIS